MTSVLTMGSFDLLHAGHVALFFRCRDLLKPGGILTVAVNTDEFIAAFKGRPPTMTLDERIKVLKAMRDIDRVVVNDGTDQAALIEQVSPNYLVVGVDWAGRDYMAQLGITLQWLAERNIVLLFMAHPESMSVSSTAIRARLARGSTP